MNIYKFNNISEEKTFVVGDIHGNFNPLSYFIKVNKRGDKDANDFSDSIIIIAGDCGFGFYKKGFYIDTLGYMEKILDKINCHVFFIRGNHDDPSYFDGNMINFKHITAIPDYSVIQIRDYDILCVGGAISLDRSARIAEMNKSSEIYRHENPTYWENEKVVYDEDKLNELKNAGLNITAIISHTAPSFFPIQNDAQNGMSGWFIRDKELRKDTNEERMNMDKLFNYSKNNFNLKKWVYGHFHDIYTGEYEGVKYKMMNLITDYEFTYNSLNEI